MTPRRPRLWAWAVFSALIAAAGLPIYIHAPQVYAETYGIGLGALGAVLGVLRLFDVVADPVLGWLAARGRARRKLWVALAVAILAVAMLGLFALRPPVGPLWWFAAMLALLFCAYSFLTIVFYAGGVARAEAMGPGGHLRLAGWREGGALVGVSVAAVAPVLLGTWGAHPHALFAMGFAVFALLATWAMAREWPDAAPHSETAAIWQAFRPALADRLLRGLLILSLVNAAPVAVTSTLFLFFVRDRLGLPDLAGVFLLVFFISAAGAAGLWARLAARIGARAALAVGMGLAIVSFVWAATLGPGQALAFGAICVASGAAMGGDLVILPALFSRRLAELGQTGAEVGFGLWNFAAKLALALAAALVLPALQMAGYTPGPGNGAAALGALGLAYAVLPCGLKLAALALLARLRIEAHDSVTTTT